MLPAEELLFLPELMLLLEVLPDDDDEDELRPEMVELLLELREPPIVVPLLLPDDDDEDEYEPRPM